MTRIPSHMLAQGRSCLGVVKSLSAPHGISQVLHIRGFSGGGLSFVMLLAACFALFSVECRSLEVAAGHDPGPQAAARIYRHRTHPARAQARWAPLSHPVTEGKRLLWTCARHLPPQKSWAGVASRIHATFCMGSTSSGQLSVCLVCVLAGACRQDSCAVGGTSSA